MSVSRDLGAPATSGNPGVPGELGTTDNSGVPGNSGTPGEPGTPRQSPSPGAKSGGGSAWLRPGAKLTWLTWIVLVLGAGIVGVLLPFCAQAVAPKQVSYIALPHPDDEWQVWSLVENSPDNYKVFILMTQGEQTRFCPQKYSSECTALRVSSWVGFFQQISQLDPTIPGDFKFLGSKGPFAARGYSLEREDAGVRHPASRLADVYLDRLGRGALVVFDLGDGDLTPAEVTWAIETVRDNRETLGLDTDLPNYNLLGAYYNDKYEGCISYPHPDHGAVHRALYTHDFGFAYNAGATCASDPDVWISQDASPHSIRAVWGGQADQDKAQNSAGTATETAEAEPPGIFAQNYAWLGDWVFSQQQDELFMRTQSFWRR